MEVSITQRFKNDIFGCISVIASLVMLLLFFVYFHLADGEFSGGVYFPIDIEIFGRVFEELSYGDMDDVFRVATVFPLYLLCGLVVLAAGIAPSALLVATFVACKAQLKKRLLIAALVVNAVGYPISFILSGLLAGSGFDLPPYLFIGFGLQLLTMAAFLVCALALPDNKLAVPVACAALCCVALVMTLMAVPPFGYDYGSLGWKSFRISTFLWYVSFCVAVAFAFMSVNQLNSEGFFKDAPPSVLHLSGDSPSETAAYLPISEASECIKELKELVDVGALTQEEFENKKKELLGL